MKFTRKCGGVLQQISAETVRGMRPPYFRLKTVFLRGSLRGWWSLKRYRRQEKGYVYSGWKKPSGFCANARYRHAKTTLFFFLREGGQGGKNQSGSHSSTLFHGKTNTYLDLASLGQGTAFFGECESNTSNNQSGKTGKVPLSSRWITRLPLQATEPLSVITFSGVFCNPVVADSWFFSQEAVWFLHHPYHTDKTGETHQHWVHPKYNT